MANILSTEAVVLRKSDYGDTSKIVSLFSEQFGKIQVIIKGARSPKSKIGKPADTLNCVNVIYYDKPGRDIQLLTQIDLVNDYKNIKSDYNTLLYATAIIELFEKLIVDQDEHLRLYNGLKRILHVMNTDKPNSKLLFAKFYFFFIREIGYAPHIVNCSECNNSIENFTHAAYNFEHGLFCDKCISTNLTNFEFDQELLKTVVCLKNKNNEQSVSDVNLDKIIFFFEKYMSYHIQEYSGLKSLQMII